MNAILSLTPCLRSVFGRWLSAPISRSICHVTSGMQNTSLGISANSLLPSGILGHQPIRTIVREHFPRPSEVKRIRKHGWQKRMSTYGGRRVIMRRILKGRHCLTH